MSGAKTSPKTHGAHTVLMVMMLAAELLGLHYVEYLQGF